MFSVRSVNERPIIFSGAMVRAILDGSKTQTRRVVKPQKAIYEEAGRLMWAGNGYGPSEARNNCPIARVGDTLWVRETWSPDSRQAYPYSNFVYRASDDYYTDHRDTCKSMARSDECLTRNHAPTEGCLCNFKWRPSIHMPRYVCRIRLKVTGVRVERLKQISSEDAKAEGVESWMKSLQKDGYYDPDAHLSGYLTTAFARMWSHVMQVDGDTAWSANPWVWVLDFKRITNGEA